MGRGETNAKKRKRLSEAKASQNGVDELLKTSQAEVVNIDTSKPTALFESSFTGRDWTVSIAVPGSIIANAQSHELRTAMAGQIARALAVFCVDEVIVFSDGDTTAATGHQRSDQTVYQDEYTGSSDPDHFLVHILSYLETPPHLRRRLFPIHPNLRTAGTLPSLDLPHHLRSDEWCLYREGVTIGSSLEFGTLVEAGLRLPVTINAHIPPNTRVTLQFAPNAKAASKDREATAIDAEAINPNEPREESGYFWGYSVRKASNLSAVFTECMYDGGFDLTIGTSERGEALEDMYNGVPGKFKHLLIVFGGVAGLEFALKNDMELQKLGVREVKDVFDKWVNVCPGQGSRTIRTEEAVWIGLMGLRKLVEGNCRPKVG